MYERLDHWKSIEINKYKDKIARKFEKLNWLILKESQNIKVKINNKYITFSLQNTIFEITINNKKIKIGNDIKVVEFKKNKLVVKNEKREDKKLIYNNYVDLQNLFDNFELEIMYYKLADFIK